MYNYYLTPLGHMTGLSLDRISPDDVFKNGEDDIQVSVHGKKDGEPIIMNFFTVKAAIRGIKPSQADSGDIN